MALHRRLLQAQQLQGQQAVNLRLQAIGAQQPQQNPWVRRGRRVRRIGQRANNLIRLLALIIVGTVTIWPLVTLGVALLVGTWEAVAGVTLLLFSLLAIATLIALLPWPRPLVAAVIATIPFGRQLLQSPLTIVAGLLLISTYFMFVPVRNDPWLVLPLFVVGIALGTIYLSGNLRRWGWVVAILVAIGIAITIVFFLGGRCTSPDKTTNCVSITLPQPTAQPQPSPGIVVERVDLLGYNQRSRTIDIDALARRYPGWRCNWVGSYSGADQDATVYRSDGRNAPLGHWWADAPGGTVSFTGRTGQSVEIVCRP